MSKTGANLVNRSCAALVAAYKRKRKRPVLTQWDLFWVGLSQFWSGWRDALVFVQPDTVVRWQRERVRDSGPHFRDRKVLAEEDRSLPGNLQADPADGHR